ncbi:microtubule-associated protein RP/EB family member 1-like isoform X2 [Actinia tenebrosa]|uniref:Microtubule-associated protein RP/EB family member 1-like isoform X2 n=1 Tax=Actinia tenebrosa TaxID=6105 RepID=A0A6P8I2T0_ACTTE|nr:microtubule-associated protein RP/EB family member 1-like isoform X2 [Actinia tenebrosa]
MQGTSLFLCFVIFFEITALIAGERKTRRDCRDTFHSCVSWSKAGMCENNRFGFVMRGGCAKTCGFCKDSITKTNVEASAQNSKSSSITERDENESSKKLPTPVTPTSITTATTHTTGTTPTTLTTPTTQTTPTTRTTTNTPTTPTSGTTPTTHTTPTTPTTHSTPTTVTKHTTITTPTTITTRTTYTTPTTHTTATTYATRPTLSTPTTSPTRAFPSDLKDKTKSVKTKNDDKKAKKSKCKDLFSKCEEWKEKKNICKSPKFKPYMEFGCARSCSLCSAFDEDPNIASLQDNDSVNVEIGEKKSSLALGPKSRTKDIDSKLNDVVEIGIAREMIEANKKPGKKGHHLSSTLHGKNNKIPRSKIPLKKYILKQKENSSSINNAKRVEIEDGFKSDSNPFSNLKEVANGVDKVDLQTAVLGSEAEFKTNTFDALDRDLPDFGGLDNVGDVEKLLETPKPKKKMDYYVDHFSSDPYEAESEKEQWLQENRIRPKQYRREVKNTDGQGKVPLTYQHSSETFNTKSSIPQQRLQIKQNKKNIRKLNTKRVEIEDGFKAQSRLSSLDGVSREISKVESSSSGFSSKASDDVADEGFGSKAVEVDSLEKLPDFDGLNNRKDVQELFETPTNKNFDYYVEHFSNDPYLAESEREEWMKENDSRMKQYRRRLEDTKMTKPLKHKKSEIRKGVI